MKIVCSCCEHWTSLPTGAGDGPHAHALCEHCGAPLPVDDYYRVCADCGQRYLSEYGSCPLCMQEGKQAAQSVKQLAQAVTKGLSKRTARKGQEYWQVFFDYESQAPTSPASNGQTSNKGNGHANGALNGTHSASETGNGYKTNGHASGAAHSGGSTVDLAVSEPTALTLFPEAEVKVFTEQTDSPVKVNAGTFNEFDYELIQDQSRLAEVAELLANEKIIGIDTETTGLDPHTSQLLLLQVSTLDKVYVVDCKRVLPLALKPFLENPSVLKVAQNAKFEYEILKQQAGIVINSLFDTMLAERIMTAGVSREISLKMIAEKYIGAILDKSVRESFYKTSHIDDAYLAPEQLHYAARDAFIMIPIQQRMLPELKKHKLMQVAELEFKCIAAVGDLELAGVKIDEERWRKIIADVGVQRDQCAVELSDMLAPATMQATMFGVPAINLNSNVQLIEALYKLGVELPDTMEATLVKYDHPAVKKLLEYRGFEKTLSAFGENVLGLINPKTKRIHPDFNQHGADTGRFSCTRPNVQQIPATSDFRKCFIASPGYKLVTCDYSQCELRILAELSGDEGFVTAFKSGGDLHTLTASQMFGVPVDQVQKPQRSAAKAINFGLAYGMGPGGLAPRLGVGLDEAKELIARYFQAYPGVQKWLEKAAKDSVRNGYSLTTIGRKRFYTLPDESLKQRDPDEWRKQIASIERQGKNSPIQGSNADMTKLALINLRTALKDWDARVVNTVHDEIVVEVREDQAEEVKHIVEGEMVRAGESILKVVPIVAEASLADYWSK